MTFLQNHHGTINSITIRNHHGNNVASIDVAIHFKCSPIRKVMIFRPVKFNKIIVYHIPATTAVVSGLAWFDEVLCSIPVKGNFYRQFGPFQNLQIMTK
jgi:hypothetical protein